MDVHDATGEGINKEVGHHGQETSQDDELDIVGTQEGQDDVGVVEVGLRHHAGRYAEALGALQSKGIAAVTDDEGDVNFSRRAEVADDVLAVGTTARDEDCDVHYLSRLVFSNRTSKGYVFFLAGAKVRKNSEVTPSAAQKLHPHLLFL